MNVFGNSLKFTTVRFFACSLTPCPASDKVGQDGYVHVIIRELPSTPEIPSNKVRLELVVADTGQVRAYCLLN